MMRRGPLDRYPVEWVLQQALDHAASGSLAFHGASSQVTVFVDEGHPYAAIAPADGPMPVAPPDDPLHEEPRARSHTVELLVEAICSPGGWYYFDPLVTHPSRGLWRWDAADLLHDARTRSPEVTAAAMTGNRTVHLLSDVGDEVSLDADSWAVVAAMAATATSEELRARLGWAPTRMLRALSRLNHRGVLDPNPPELDSDRPVPGGASVPSGAELDALASALTPSAPRPAAASVPAPTAGAHPEDLDPLIPQELVNPEPPPPPGVKPDQGIGVNSPRSHAWLAWQSVSIPEDPHRGPLEAPADWESAADPSDPVEPAADGRRRGLRRRRRPDAPR